MTSPPRTLPPAALLGALLACGGPTSPPPPAPPPPPPASASAGPPLSSLTPVAPPPPPAASASVVASASASAPAASGPPSLEEGCSLWSATEHAALCVTSLSSIQQGCHERLGFVGARDSGSLVTVEVPPQCLDETTPRIAEQDRARVAERLRRGGYAPLPAAALSLEAGEKKSQGSLRGALVRRKTGGVDIPMAGSWDIFQDQVQVSCGGRMVSVLSTKVENPSGAVASVFDVGGGWLVVTYKVHWGIEGDMGGLFDAVVVNPSGCQVTRAPKPAR